MGRKRGLLLLFGQAKVAKNFIRICEVHWLRNTITCYRLIQNKTSMCNHKTDPASLNSVLISTNVFVRFSQYCSGFDSLLSRKAVIQTSILQIKIININVNSMDRLEL